MPPPTKTSSIGTPTMPTPKPASISTPLPTGATKSPQGFVKTIINTIEITIKPDKYVTFAKFMEIGKLTKQQAEHIGGVTRRDFSTLLHYSPNPKKPEDEKKMLISSFKLSPMQVTIQTFYKKKVNPLDDSAYGSGTTTEDIANGNISLQFHEGSHGSRYLRFFEENILPAFGGKVGDTVEKFKEAWAIYQNDIGIYFNELELRQRRDVECVGTPDDKTFDDGTTCSSLGTPNPNYR